MRLRSRIVGVLTLGLVSFALAGCATGSGGSANALSNTNLSAEDLAVVQGQYNSVYDFLRAHSRARFSTESGREQVYVHSYAAGGRQDPAQVVINGREINSPIPRLKGMGLEEVDSLEILRASDAAMRYGGGGFEGAVVIRTRGGDE